MALTVPVDQIVERNSNGLLSKHPSWDRVRMGDIASVQNGAAFKSAHFNDAGRGLPLLRIRDVLRDSTAVHYDGPYEQELVVEPGDLVIGMDGDFNSAIWRGPRALLNQRVCRVVFESDEINPRFVFHALQGYLDAVNEVTSAVTVKHLSSKTVAQLPLPFPPRAEQDRIVEAVESAMGAVDQADRSLGEAIALLSPLRAALINAALATGEDTVSLGEVAEVKSGLTKGRKTKGSTTDVPFLRAANVQDGYLDLREVKTIPATPEERRAFELRKGDMLLVEGSGSSNRIGQGWLWQEEVQGCLHQNHVFRARPDTSRVLPEYLAWALQGPTAKAHFHAKAKTTSGLSTINRTHVRETPVPIPAVGTQREIVARLTGELEAVTGLSDEIERRKQGSEVLRRSILHRAFTGQLVPQDPDDEPASELLEHIKAEKAEREAELKAAKKRARENGKASNGSKSRSKGKSGHRASAEATR